MTMKKLIDIKDINDRSENLGAILCRLGGWALLSTHVNDKNLLEGELSAGAEERNNYNLRTVFAGPDSSFTPVVGRWGGEVENSYLVIDPRFQLRGFRDEILKLFRQDAIITDSGYLEDGVESDLIGFEALADKSDLKKFDEVDGDWTFLGGDYFTLKFDL